MVEGVGPEILVFLNSSSLSDYASVQGCYCTPTEVNAKESTDLNDRRIYFVNTDSNNLHNLSCVQEKKPK